MMKRKRKKRGVYELFLALSPYMCLEWKKKRDVIYEQPKKVVKYSHRSIIKQITTCTQTKARIETYKKWKSECKVLIYGVGQPVRCQNKIPKKKGINP